MKYLFEFGQLVNLRSFLHLGFLHKHKQRHKHKHRDKHKHKHKQKHNVLFLPVVFAM